MLNRPFDLSVNQRTKNFNKVIRVDSDKSISIRSFLIGSICQKISTVKNVLESDLLCTRSVQKMPVLSFYDEF